MIMHQAQTHLFGTKKLATNYPPTKTKYRAWVLFTVNNRDRPSCDSIFPFANMAAIFSQVPHTLETGITYLDYESSGSYHLHHHKAYLQKQKNKKNFYKFEN